MDFSKKIVKNGLVPADIFIKKKNEVIIMVSQISALSSMTQASAGDKLTEETKAKLQALGIDTSSIKTETQGLMALAAAKKAKAAAKAKGAHGVKPAGGNAQEESLKTQAKELAAKLNVSVSSDDDTTDILTKIASVLANMRVQAASDPQKLQEVEKYQAEYDALSSSVANLQKQKQQKQAQLTGSLDAMAMYNKIGLGIS